MEKKSYMVGEGFSEEAHWNRRHEGTSRQAQQGRKEREQVKSEQLWTCHSTLIPLAMGRTLASRRERHNGCDS